MNKEMKNILVLTSSFPQSLNTGKGGGGFVLELSKRLSKYHNITVLAPALTNNKKPSRLGRLNVVYFNFLPPIDWIYNYFQNGIFSAFRKSFLLLPFIISFMVVQLYKTLRLIKAGNIQVIHAHWIIPQGLIAVLVKTIFNIETLKIVVTSHGSDINHLNGTFGRYLKAFVLNNIDDYTVVSQELATSVKKQFNNYPNIHVVPMGIDTTHFRPDMKTNSIINDYQDKKYLLIFVGRLTKQKGITYLIQAMPEVLSKFPNAQLLIIGDGELKESLKQQVNSLSIQNDVDFLGYVPHQELSKYMASADMFIGPSISEGFGLVFAEAASSGTIVIGTKKPAIQDIIIDDKTGFLVQVASAKAISKKVIYCIDNIRTDQFEKIRTQARKHVVGNFDWKIIAQKYKNIIT